MSPEMRQMVLNGDEIALENAFFSRKCSDFLIVDWRGDDAEIVEDCAKCMGLASLAAEWQGENLVVTYEGRESVVPLQQDFGDRHVTICALNDLLAPSFEIRFLVVSHGSDSLGLAALGVADWQLLERANAAVVAENFIDPRKLPNLFTELTNDTLPAAARSRHERMVERNRRR